MNSRKPEKKNNTFNRRNTTDHRRVIRGGCAFPSRPLERAKMSLPKSSNRFDVGGSEFSIEEKGIVEQAITRELKDTELRKICNAIIYKKPEGSNKNKLVLLEITPHLTHAYWELGNVEEKVDTSNLTLRYYEVSNSGGKIHNQFDIDVNQVKNKHVTEHWEEGKNFYAEIGYKDERGEFISLATSSIVSTPRTNRFDNIATELLFVTPTKIEERKPKLSGKMLRKKASTNNDKDFHTRDIQAENAVREIYNRFTQEGPRVLSNRKAIVPSPKEQRIKDYNKRKEERRRTSIEISRQRKIAAFIQFPVAGKEKDIAKNNEQHQEFSLNRRTMPSITLPAQRKNTPKIIRPRIKHSKAESFISQKNWISIIDSKGEAEHNKESLNITGTQKTVQNQNSFMAQKNASSDFSEDNSNVSVMVEDINNIESIETTEKHITTESFSKTELANNVNAKPDVSFSDENDSSENPENENSRQDNKNESDADFLAGLGIEEQPTPQRYCPEVVKSKNPQQKKSKHTKDENWKAPSIESFLAGININTEPEKEEEKIQSPEIGALVNAVIEKKTDNPKNKETKDNTVNISESNMDSRKSATQMLKKVAKTSADSEIPAVADFQMTATLNLNGQVPEGCKLILDGKEVELSAKNTFEIQCTIKDGVLDIPFELTGKENSSSKRTGKVELKYESNCQYSMWDNAQLKR